MCIKGLVYHLSHDCHFDIDHDVSTTHCRSSSGDSVGLLSQTICTTVVVSDWCITNLAHGWWVSIQSTGTLVEFQEAIQITLHPNNINRDSGSEIPEAWMPTIRRHNSRSLPKRTAERSVSSSDNTWPTMPWIETHQPLARFVIQQSLTTTVVQIVWLSKSTISPDEDLKSAVETSRSIWKWQLWD